MSEAKILLHICCGPCAAGCLDPLREAGLAITFYFSNSNLDSRAEYDRRLEAASILAEAEHIELLCDPYDHAAWLERCGALAAEPEGGGRCRKCFAWSLERTARAAETFGFPEFATSLTVSPRKNSELIFQVGAAFDRFRPWNFKKKDGYGRGTRRARELGLYRQNYCGCEFSLRDRMAFLKGQTSSVTSS